MALAYKYPHLCAWPRNMPLLFICIWFIQEKKVTSPMRRTQKYVTITLVGMAQARM